MKTHFSEEFLEKATETLRAIGHPLRIAIIDLLEKHGQLTVTELYQKLRIEQAVASHHLRILKDKNIVFVRKKGRNSLYSLVNKHYYEIVNTLVKAI